MPISHCYRPIFLLLSATIPMFATTACANEKPVPASPVVTPLLPAAFELFDFKNGSLNGRIDASPNALQAGGKLTIRTSPDEGASVTLRPSGERWNLENWTRVELKVANPTDQPLRLCVRVQNQGSSDWGRSAINSGFLSPREWKTFNIFLYRADETRERYPELKQFDGMKGLPGGLLSHWHVIDASDVRSLQIEVFAASQAQQLDILDIRATHPIVPAILQAKGEKFFPFVDQFGQYAYDQWPGKVSSEAQLKRNAFLEADDLRAHPGPPQWDKYGGWQNGPQLKANGHFQTAKVDGKWWLVDPEGHLFWSHGPNSVGTDSAGTRVTGREKYFQSLPPRTGATEAMWWQGKPDAPLNFNFLHWNMLRQYGPGWEVRNRDLTHQRLRSWGLNTIGNWSDSKIEAQNRTPFTASLWPWSPTIGGDTTWDVFHPDFVKNFESGIASGVEQTADNPWCIGYFVHNEMAWPGNALGLVSQVLAAAPETATKRELVNSLRETMPDVAEFNRKTKRDFADWDAVTANRENFDLSGVQPEAEAFYTRYAEKYFQTCAEALHKYAPHKLYLGSRMHVSNPLSIHAAAKWCDVLSFNLYQDDISGFRPADTDKPVIASEFHFGALDRGMFGTGLRPASDQNDRAAKYRFYVQGAARNPYIVGAHWFAYCTQALTGRGDGENYEDGFFDITNNPYPELRGALRDVGYSLYQTRSEK